MSLLNQTQRSFGATDSHSHCFCISWMLLILIKCSEFLVLKDKQYGHLVLDIYLLSRPWLYFLPSILESQSGFGFQILSGLPKCNKEIAK